MLGKLSPPVTGRHYKCDFCQTDDLTVSYASRKTNLTNLTYDRVYHICKTCLKDQQLFLEFNDLKPVRKILIEGHWYYHIE